MFVAPAGQRARYVARMPARRCSCFRPHERVMPRASPRAAAGAANVAPPSADLSKRTALITGGNSGIGFETAKALGAEGYHTVIGCRDESKGRAALQQLRDGNPAGSFELQIFALDDLSSVRDFGKKACDAGIPLDVLINNAGVMACPQMATKDGFEYQLGVNHLGHFVLTAGLLPVMTDPGRSSRIINVSSSAHSFGTINFDDINLSKNYNNWLAYGQSKLANVLFTFELAKRLPYAAKLTCNTLHPGVVATSLARYLEPETKPFFYPALQRAFSLFLKSPPQGAETSIYLATAADVEGITGKYYVDCKPQSAQPKAYDAELREKFWELSQELTGTTFDVEQALRSDVVNMT